MPRLTYKQNCFGIEPFESATSYNEQVSKTMLLQACAIMFQTFFTQDKFRMLTTLTLKESSNQNR
jgi:hypothetical protein